MSLRFRPSRAADPSGPDPQPHPPAGLWLSGRCAVFYSIGRLTPLPTRGFGAKLLANTGFFSLDARPLRADALARRFGSTQGPDRGSGTWATQPPARARRPRALPSRRSGRAPPTATPRQLRPPRPPFDRGPDDRADRRLYLGLAAHGEPGHGAAQHARRREDGHREHARMGTASIMRPRRTESRPPPALAISAGSRARGRW
jgi:hypothetical protein